MITTQRALAGSRFVAATVVPGRHWTGQPYTRVEWSWKDGERAALVAHLRAAGLRCEDRVAAVIVWE